MDKKQFEWKKIGIVAVIIWICSLPIAIWRSSHIGKLIYLALFLIIISKCIAPITNMYFNVTNLVQARTELKPILKNIELIKDNNKEITEQISNVNNQYLKLVDERVDRANKAMDSKFASINEKLDEIDKSADILREQERDTLKRRIVELKEQVKLHKHSIDESPIRIEAENINKRISLLTSEEKHRFIQDLKDIGFQTEKLEGQIVRVYSGNFSMVSCDAVAYRPIYATGDSVSYQYNND